MQTYGKHPICEITWGKPDAKWRSNVQGRDFNIIVIHITW